ncbi:MULTISPECIES: TAXI family TRAP transporter solute-binding subunit [unclassified Marinobacter]|uniref:TAXI family TRAP transporter solute-binding subunit n=1 Tax=unclassified Marinobacter TaxID=83889 RepID=UPI0020103FC3|nr:MULTISPECIES: TAXI family TRAP transporter solute-binding subunit [unclassified Marinobacter]MCL1481436.1 TAXI family TRAP transporter solute-binding subunit [Marinobacter sp.]UQG54517.1 TAXI family TRAP transporter solute-binding subunit [Marinobacter sp. M4C]UQG63322.1 TAXI family TRAP transporter solute-binding subunit [Marinobacter sp. M2C]UQG67602.1 TAXI family TRAP transporter solute-binding subunit [Marinobacter sp. M1C]
MSTTLKSKVAGLILGVSLALPAVASAEPAHLLFAAAPTGSTWYAYAGTLHSAMLEELPPGSSVAIMNTPMAIANTKLLTGERADIGMIFPPVANWAAQGFGPFDSKVENVRGLVGGMDQYYQRITVQKDSPIKSLADIKEQKLPVRIGTGPRGSLNEYIARLILQSYGLSYEDIESFGGNVAMNSFGVLRNQFGDNQIDMIIGITTPGHPNTAQLSIAPGQRFLSLSDESVAYLKEYGFSPATMPANTFEGQNEPVEGVGFPTSLYANKALSEELAYQITKGIMENRKRLKQQFGSMASWKAEESAKQENLQMPLHPGAERYYREAGILK